MHCKVRSVPVRFCVCPLCWDAKNLDVYSGIKQRASTRCHLCHSSHARQWHWSGCAHIILPYKPQQPARTSNPPPAVWESELIPHSIIVVLILAFTLHLLDFMFSLKASFTYHQGLHFTIKLQTSQVPQFWEWKFKTVQKNINEDKRANFQ